MTPREEQGLSKHIGDATGNRGPVNSPEFMRTARYPLTQPADHEKLVEVIS